MISCLDPSDLVLIEFNVPLDNLLEAMHLSNSLMTKIIKSIAAKADFDLFELFCIQRNYG